MDRLPRWLIGALFLCLATGGVALASGGQSPATDGPPPGLLLSFLLPGGLILLLCAALPEDRAAETATGAVIAWSLAGIAYWAVGFAFQFGGVAVVSDAPDLAGLYWEYSLLDVTWGTGWGMIGLRGFFLADAAGTPGALALFLAQLPLLGVVAVTLQSVLWARAPRGLVVPAGLLVGGLIYPVAGNWVWGGGWLANLGLTLGYGHGFVDMLGGGQVALLGAAAALAAALSIGRVRAAAEPAAGLVTPMPAAHLPLLGWLGALLMVVGWLATTGLAHLPDGAGIPSALSATNLALAAAGAACASGLYAWFATGRLDVLMAGRGMAAGLAVAAAGAAFVPTWAAPAAGFAVGITLPPVLWACERARRLGPAAAPLAALGLPAALGLLLPGLLADGRFGVGWNRVGVESYLGVPGQGVSGAWAADWPGQLYAQLIGLVAIAVWSFGLSWLALAVPAAVIRAWQRSGLEFGTPPAPLPPDDDLAAEAVSVSDVPDVDAVPQPAGEAPLARESGGSAP